MTLKDSFDQSMQFVNTRQLQKTKLNSTETNNTVWYLLFIESNKLLQKRIIN